MGNIWQYHSYPETKRNKHVLDQSNLKYKFIVHTKYLAESTYFLNLPKYLKVIVGSCKKSHPLRKLHVISPTPKR